MSRHHGHVTGFGNLHGADDSKVDFHGNRSSYDRDTFNYTMKSSHDTDWNNTHTIDSDDNYGMAYEDAFRPGPEQVNIDINATRKLLRDIQQSIMGFQKAAEDAGKSQQSSDLSQYDRESDNRRYSMMQHRRLDADQCDDTFDYKNDKPAFGTGRHGYQSVEPGYDVRSDSPEKSFEIDVDRLIRDSRESVQLAQDKKFNESQTPYRDRGCDDRLSASQTTREVNWSWPNTANRAKIDTGGQEQNVKNFIVPQRRELDMEKSHYTRSGHDTDQPYYTQRPSETQKQRDISTAASSFDPSKNDRNWQADIWDFIRKSQNEKSLAFDNTSVPANSSAKNMAADHGIHEPQAQILNFKVCQFCNFRCHDEQSWNLHINGIQHRMTMAKVSRSNQRKMPESQQTSTEPSAVSKMYTESSTVPKTCKICNVTCSTEVNWQEHINSSEHAERCQLSSEVSHTDEGNHGDQTNTSKSTLDKGNSNHGNAPPAFQRGDWYCPQKNCKAHNYAHRLTCFKCQAKKFDAQEKLKRGDWMCPKVGCEAHNFAHRKTCYKCKIPKPMMEDLQGSSGQQNCKPDSSPQMEVTNAAASHYGDMRRPSNKNPAEMHSAGRIARGWEHESHEQKRLSAEEQGLGYRYKSLSSDEGRDIFGQLYSPIHNPECHADRSEPAKHVKEQASPEEDQAVKVREITDVVENMDISTDKKQCILSELMRLISKDPNLRLDTLKQLTQTFLLLHDTVKSGKSASLSGHPNRPQNRVKAVEDVAGVASKLMPSQHHTLSDAMQSKLGSPLLSVQDQKLGQVRSMVPPQSLLGMFPVPPGMQHRGPQLPMVRGQLIPFGHMGYNMTTPQAVPIMLSQPHAHPGYQMSPGTTINQPFPTQLNQQQPPMRMTVTDIRNTGQIERSDVSHPASSSAPQMKDKRENMKSQTKIRNSKEKWDSEDEDRRRSDVEKGRKKGEDCLEYARNVERRIRDQTEQNVNSARSAEKNARSQTDDRREQRNPDHRSHENSFTAANQKAQRQGDNDRKQTTDRSRMVDKDHFYHNNDDDNMHLKSSHRVFSEGRFQNRQRSDDRSHNNREDQGRLATMEHRKRTYEQSFQSSASTSQERIRQTASPRRKNTDSFGMAEIMAKKGRKERARDADLREKIQESSSRKSDGEGGMRDSSERRSQLIYEEPFKSSASGIQERSRQTASQGRGHADSFGIAEMISGKRRKELAIDADHRQRMRDRSSDKREGGDGSRDSSERRSQWRNQGGLTNEGDTDNFSNPRRLTTGHSKGVHSHTRSRERDIRRTAVKHNDPQFIDSVPNADMALDNVHMVAGGQSDPSLDMTEEEMAMVRQVQLMTGVNDPVMALQAVRMVTVDGQVLLPADTPVSERPHVSGQEVYRTGPLQRESPVSSFDTRRPRREERMRARSHAVRHPQREGQRESINMVREVMEMSGIDDVDMAQEAVDLVLHVDEDLIQ